MVLGEGGQPVLDGGHLAPGLGQGADVEGDAGRSGGQRGQGVDLTPGLEVGQVGAVACAGCCWPCWSERTAGLVLEQSRCQRRLGQTREAGGER
jgi:hypothetical protein